MVGACLVVQNLSSMCKTLGIIPSNTHILQEGKLKERERRKEK